MPVQPRPAQRISSPVVITDLGAQLAALRRSDTYVQNDHASATLVRRKGLGVVLVALPRGGHLKEHRAKRGISIQVLDGKVRLDLEDQQVDLAAGQMISLAANLRHSVTGLAKSGFLLTMGGEAGT